MVSGSRRSGARSAMVMRGRRERSHRSGARSAMVMRGRRERRMVMPGRGRRRQRPVVSWRRRGRRYHVNHGHIRRGADHGFSVAVIIAVINENAACEHRKSYCYSGNGNYWFKHKSSCVVKSAGFSVSNRTQYC